jgi:hypothetical protein
MLLPDIAASSDQVFQYMVSTINSGATQVYIVESFLKTGNHWSHCKRVTCASRVKTWAGRDERNSAAMQQSIAEHDEEEEVKTTKGRWSKWR